MPELFENYDSVDRSRAIQFTQELLSLQPKAKQAAAEIELEYAFGKGSGNVATALSMMRGQADAIERVAALQQRQVEVMRELADIMERNNPTVG